jgi:hypothetical protein
VASFGPRAELPPEARNRVADGIGNGAIRDAHELRGALLDSAPEFVASPEAG